MAVFKIWNNDRTIKKCCICECDVMKLLNKGETCIT